jgi:hypothetical protein
VTTISTGEATAPLTPTEEAANAASKRVEIDE